MVQVGIIGSGQLGLTIGALLGASGRDVMVSTRRPVEAEALARNLGPGVRVGTPVEAARFGRTLVLCVPMRTIPDLARELAFIVRGKTLIDPTNPSRSGGSTGEVIAGGRGSGRWTARHFDSAFVVKAFNTLPSSVLAARANREKRDVAIPIAGDDEGALRRVSDLVHDVGFVPVLVGGLDSSRLLDVGSRFYGKVCSPDALRGVLIEGG